MGAKVFITPKQAENTQQTQYTAVNTRAIIDNFTVTNTSANNVTLSVNLIPTGESSSNANLIIKQRNIAPGETYTFPGLVGKCLESGWSISTIASAATSLTISANGREFS